MVETTNGTETKPPAEKKTPTAKLVSPEEFITSSPLFVRVDTDNFHAPNQIKFDCFGACKTETDWFRVYEPTALGKGCENGEVADWKMESVAYRCFRCRKATLTVVYRELDFEKRMFPARVATSFSRSSPPPPPSTFDAVTTVMKMGQYPAPTIYVPKGLEENLGKDATALYRKALMTRNLGHGLAAVGYMRRVVEDKTNELIEVAAEFAETNNVDAAIVTQIRAALDVKKYTPYEMKLEIAAAVFPDNLKVGDINPLQVLFQQVSKGLHGLSEEECVKSSDEIRTVFEYVFENLRAQVISRRAFVDRVKKLSNSSD